MLVLTRKIGQEIVIDGDIRIKVVAIESGRVRIGIVAPEEVIVDRQEIHEKRPKWADNAICQNNLLHPMKHHEERLESLSSLRQEPSMVLRFDDCFRPS